MKSGPWAPTSPGGPASINFSTTAGRDRACRLSAPATTVQVDDFGCDSRYPSFAPAAATTGVASWLSAPMTASGQTIEGLNRRDPHAYDPPAVETSETGRRQRLAARSQPAKPTTAASSHWSTRNTWRWTRRPISSRQRTATALTTKSPSEPYPRAGVAQRRATPAHLAMKQSGRPTMHMPPPRAWASTRHAGTATSTFAR
jgi:hypothetical protein